MSKEHVPEETSERFSPQRTEHTEMSANLMASKGSSCWAKNLLSLSKFCPCLFCCVWRWGRKKSAQADEGKNHSFNNFNAGKTCRTPSSIQRGSSSVVPICDNQGVHLNPLNTTSQPSFPLSLGMLRLFVSLSLYNHLYFYHFPFLGVDLAAFSEVWGFFCWIQS